MNKSLKTPIGEFTAQIDQVLGKKIEAYLGIPYAKATPFELPELVDSYSAKPANVGYGLRFPFPQKEEIRDVYDSDLFDRLQKDFMRGRDAGFIA